MNVTARPGATRRHVGPVRLVVATITAAALLLALSASLAGPAKADWFENYRHDYQGTIEKGKFIYYIGFDRKKDTVKKLSVSIPLFCNQGGGMFTFMPLDVKGKFQIKNDRLLVDKQVKLRLPVGPSPKIKGKLNLDLRFKAKNGKKAVGTIQPDLRIAGGGGLNCRFGELKLAAKKGARVNPELLVP